HGESLMEHGYLGHGRKVYQDNLHIPWIITGPGITARRSEAPVRGLDFAPTVLGLAGLPPLADAAGVDVLASEPGSDRVRIIETYGGAAIVPGMKESMAEAKPIYQAILGKRWKLIRGEGDPELYDLETDP